MIIALDYDGTFTKDPPFWVKFIDLCKEHGHEVYIATSRYPEEEIKLDLPIFYSARRPKIFGLLRSDVWIDNNPFDITGYPK